jgi:hypothetical protein
MKVPVILATLALLIVFVVCGALIALGHPSEAPVRFRRVALTLPSDLPQGSEAALQYQYRVRCEHSSRPILHELNASVALSDRTIRFNLFEARSSGELIIGKVPGKPEPEIRIDENPHCRLESFHARATELAPERDQGPAARLALQHAPYLVVREDQLRNKGTDLPILLAYSVQSQGTTRTLRYTVYFTDEDSMSSTRDTNEQMTQYGRRTDIEWLYEVTLDDHDQVISRRYQGDWFRGWGHTVREFRGKFITGTEHPILFDIASHNVFSDRPRGEQTHAGDVGYHLVPRVELHSSEPREWAMFRHPWIFQVSDQELAYEGKLARPATAYLFVGTSRSPARAPLSRNQLRLLSASRAEASEEQRARSHASAPRGFTARPLDELPGSLLGAETGARELRIISSAGHYEAYEILKGQVPWTGDLASSRVAVE